ncbi:MAG: AI-2E family transporter [Synergistaceae bacterium]|nr:AI-2E family transporter [Synergistaceae bacterium]
MPFIIFFVLFAILAWDITAPISTPTLWAAMLSFISMPIYRLVNQRLMRNRFPGLAAGITLALFLLICLVPILYALSTLGIEAAGMGADFSRLLAKIQQQAYSGKDFDFPAWLPIWAADYLTSFLENSEAVKSVLQYFAQWSAKFLSSLSAYLIEQGSGFILNVMITTMISFFFIRDGEKIVDYVKSVIPLSNDEMMRTRISSRAPAASSTPSSTASSLPSRFRPSSAALAGGSSASEARCSSAC